LYEEYCAVSSGDKIFHSLDSDSINWTTEEKEIVYAQHSVRGFLVQDDLTTTTEKELIARGFDFLAVHISDAPVVNSFILKGLLGLSTRGN